MRIRFLSTILSVSIMMVGSFGNAAFAEVKEADILEPLGCRTAETPICRSGNQGIRGKRTRISKSNRPGTRKTALYAGLKTALRAGQAPDIFYAEPDQVEYIENDFLLDLSDLDWDSVEGWAKAAWTHDGKPYGLPLEAWTVELYYNTETMAELGIEVAESLQFSPEEFLDLVKKSRAAGVTPMSLGVGDPSVSRRARNARGVAEDARHGRLWQAPQGAVAVGRSTRPGHPQLGEGTG